MGLRAMKEWRDITGYEGLYQVSSLGEVKGLDRAVKRSNGRTMTVKGKTVSQQEYKKYKRVTLCNTKRETLWVHRIVYGSFFDIPKGMEIDHIDRNPSNNKLNNLRLCTRRQNTHNSIRKIGKSGFVGVRNHRRKYKAYNGRKYLGIYNTAIEAATVYDEAILIERGSFAVTNISLGLYGKEDIC